MTAEWFMKRVLLLAAMSAIGGNAIAADLSPPVAYPPLAPATYIPIAPAYYYSWTGVYIGGNLGVGWSGSGGISDTFGSTFSTMTNTQFLGGVQFGVNYEFPGGVVVGAEAMFDGLPNTRNTIGVTGGGPAAGSTATATINNRWITTATGKLGYAWDRVLLYGKGGVAWVGGNDPGITVNGGPAAFSSSSSTNLGWAAGIGVEWAFAVSWSVRAEYDFIGLNNKSFTVGGAGPFGSDVININNRNIQMVTAGLNYTFGAW
jgi:outer membrane immunogenic protein